MLITLNQLKTSLLAFKDWMLARIPSKTSDLTNDSGFITAEDETVKDVQVNGISILDGDVANIPVAGANNIGLLGVDTSRGLALSTTGKVSLVNAKSNDIKIGTEAWKSITPVRQHESVFYGLAKASGDSTQSASDNPIGTYTEEAKTAIRNMLDVPSIDDIPEAPVQDVQVNGTSILNDGVANVLIAPGGGLKVMGTGIATDPAYKAHITAGSDNYRPITPSSQHTSTFYGLAKAAGDTTQSASSNPVGTYTDSAKTSIKTMLGVEDPVDVQINGTSIVNNGVANIPIASSTDYGAIQTNTSYGTGMYNGKLFISKASNAQVKGGTEFYKPIVPKTQHESAFYGLAKAAGDTTQSASSNAVGTYTDEAKAAIKTMLGIDTITVDSIPTTEIDTLFA